MTQRDKPSVFWGGITRQWHWSCPGGGGCTAETRDCFGESTVWEVAVIGANEHVRDHHHQQPLPHDPDTPPNGQPKVWWNGDGTYRTMVGE